MTLQDEITAWDQKSREGIEAIYRQSASTPNFAEDLINLTSNPVTARGATWLLKHHLETENTQLDAALAAKYFRKIDHLQDWESKLHLLQSMEYLPVPASEKPRMEMFLRHCLEDDVKFVRAWAYSGFYHMARTFPEYQSAVMVLLEDALETETAGSVKARVRSVLRKGFES